MKIKTYQTVKLIMVFALAIIFSQAIIMKNFLIPVGILIAGTLIMFYLKKQVSEVMSDERDWNVAGRSALIAMQIFAWIGVIAMFVFNSLVHLNSCYFMISQTLAYSICFIMLTYTIVFRVKIRKK